MDKDDPIDDVINSDENGGTPDDEPALDLPSDPDDVLDPEPADDGPFLDLDSLDEEGDGKFEIDKTVNFKPVETEKPVEEFDVDIDKTVNFAPVKGNPEVQPKTLPGKSRRRLSAGSSAGVKRRSTSEQYQKSSTSGKSFLVKKILVYALPLSFVGFIASGFVLRNESDDILWVGLMKNLGVLDATTGTEAPDPEGKKIRPEVLEHHAVLEQITLLSTRLEELERQLRVTKTWEKGPAMKARGELNGVLQILKISVATVHQLKDWFEAYDSDYKELQAAYGEENQARVDELNAKLERDKYDEVDLESGDVIAAANRVKALQRRADVLDARFPSLEAISTGTLPDPGKKEPTKRPETGTAVSFNPAIVTPFFDISVGAWRRDDILEEDLSLFGETRSLVDTLLGTKELREDYVVLERFHLSNGIESDPVEDKRDVVKVTKEEEAIKVGGTSHACRVLQSKSEKRWVPLAGPMANQLPLQVEKEDVFITALEIGKEDLTVGEATLKCVRVKYGGTIGGNKVTRTVWYSPKVPLWIVKRISEVEGLSRVTETLLAHGRSDRPPFPVEKTEEEPEPEMPDPPSETETTKEPPTETETPEEEITEPPVETEKPEEEKTETPEEEEPEAPPKKTADDHIREVKGALKEGMTLFIQVSKAMQKGLPDDPGELKTLQESVNQAEKLFGDVIEGYRRAQEVSPDPKRHDPFIRRLQRLLTLLNGNREVIREKMEE